jgi:hypothetical protein
MEVYASYYVLSHIDDILTVAICINGAISVIIAGQTDVMIRKLQNIFR